MKQIPHKVFLVAAEASGDQLGAGIIRNLKLKNPNLLIEGIGGSKMSDEGVTSDFDIAPLAIMGFTEALKAYPVVTRKVKDAARMIMTSQPNAVVLIDSWGFMIRLAEALRRASYTGKIIKYVAPQVWAMREGRAKVLSAAVDHLLTIHSFDAPYFERHGLPVTFVGNPMFDDKFIPSSDVGAFRERYKLPNDAKLGAVLFGSRPAEIDRLYHPFTEAIDSLSGSHPDWKFFSPLSDSVAPSLRDMIQSENIILLPESEKYDLFQAADVALACSGTVTTQLAIMGVPSVVAYKLSPSTFFIAKRLFKPNHISLINISAGAALMPEYVQKDCTPGNLSTALKAYMDDEALRTEANKALIRQAAIMKGKGGPAFNRAASAILEVLATA